MKDEIDGQRQLPRTTAGSSWDFPDGLKDQAAPAGRQSPPRLAYRVKETAQMLGISEKSVRRLIARGLLRTSKALRHLLIPRSEIERFLKETL